MRKFIIALMALTTLGGMLANGGAMAGEPVKAINFRFTDVAGKTVKLSDFKGKWVLVNFWAPWCPLCWPEVPDLNALNEREDVVVIGMAMDYGPDEQSAVDAIPRHNLRYHTNILGGSRRDPNSPSRQVGPVDFFPTSYLYAPNGEVVMFNAGPLRSQKVVAFMQDYLAKNTQVATNAPPPPVAAPVATAAPAPKADVGKPAEISPATYVSKPAAKKKRKATKTY